LRAYLDAKYRDLWERALPSEWLYQLSIYAAAAPCEISVLLYATMSGSASDGQIEVRQPIASGRRTSHVILRPLLLPRLAELLDRRPDGRVVAERRRFAARLVALTFEPSPGLVGP
jgi:5-methylcytosine-specific restriction enzyme subunit McrC